jgi:plasmid stabilization system protein ParE
MALGKSPEQAAECAERIAVELRQLLELPEGEPVRKLVQHMAMHRGDKKRFDELDHKYRAKLARLVARRGSPELQEVFRRGYDPQEQGS